MHWVRTRQWAIGGLGSGLFGLFPCFLSTTFLTNQGEDFFFSPPWPKDNTIVGHPVIPQELQLVPLSIPSKAAVEPVHPK